MKKVLVLAIASMYLTGCATVNSMSDTVSDKLGTSKAKGQMTVGATIGCVAGGVANRVILGGSFMGGCAAGAVLGGVIGYYEGKERDLEQAKAFATELKTESSPAVTNVLITERKLTLSPEEHSKRVENNQNAPKTINMLDKMTINLNQKMIDVKDGDVTTVLGKVGKLVSNTTQSSTVTFYGKAKDSAYIRETIESGYTKKNDTKFIFKPGSKPKLVISPIPDVK